jgi:hypothetical protein
VNALKTTASIALGFLLFACLLLLGPGIVVKETVLDQSFVRNQLQDLDIGAIIEATADVQIQGIPGVEDYDYLAEDVKAALLAHQSRFKQAMVNVITEAHAYQVDGASFPLTQSLKANIQEAEPDLVASVLNDIDLQPVARQLLLDMVPSTLSGYDVQPYLEAAVPLTENWLKERFTLLLPQIYEYVFSTNYNGSPVININLFELTEQVRIAVKEAFLASPPPEVASLPPAALSLAFDAGWLTIEPQIPPSMTIDLAESLGAPGAAGSALEEASVTLRQARHYIELYQAGFAALIAITIAIFASIWAVNLSVGGGSLVTGAVFATFGALSICGGLIARDAVHSAVRGVRDVPASFADWFNNLINGVFQPFISFAVFCLIAGLVLLVISFIFQRRARAYDDSDDGYTYNDF